MKRRNLRILALVLCLAMSISLLTGCGGSKEETDKPNEPTQAEEPSGDAAKTAYAETVYVAYDNDLDTANPYGGTSSQTAWFTNATHRVLIRTNYETNELEGILAESWEDPNGDGTALRVKLKEGVKFHDGSEFDAEDVVFTWNYAKDVNNVVKPIANADDMVKEVIAEDKYTVLFNLNRAIPDFTSYLEIKMLSKDAFDSMDAAEAAKIGCGPYMVGELVSGVSFGLDRFDDYFEGIDNYPTKHIVTKVIPDQNVSVAGLQAGEVDYCFRIPSASFNTLSSASNLEMYTGNGCMSYYIGINGRKDVWKNVEMRQALAKAINKDDIINIYFEGGIGASANDNFCVPSGKGHVEVNAIGYDPDGAKELLAKNGKEGQTVKIMATAQSKGMGEVVQANLNAAGFKAEIDLVDGTNWTTLKSTGDYDIFVGDYCSYTGALLYNFNRFFTVGGTSNMFNFEDAEWEKMIAEANACSSYDEMLDKFAVMQQWAADNVPLIPVAVNTAMACANKDVGGVKLAPSDNLMEVEFLYKMV